MSEDKKQSILVVIINIKSLLPGLSPQFKFDIKGGSIGSKVIKGWQLQDQERNIASNHCEIVFIDDVFCLKDLSGKTFVNGANMPLGRSNLAKLQHKDELKIGVYDIRVLFHSEEDTIGADSNLDQYFLNNENYLLDNSSLRKNEEGALTKDTGFILDESRQKEILSDFLSDDHPKHDKGALLETQDKQVSASKTFESDSEHDIESSIYLKSISDNPAQETPSKEKMNHSKLNQNTVTKVKESNMEKFDLDLLEEEIAKNTTTQTKQYQGTDHLVTGPIIKGLGVEIGTNNNMQQMHQLSEELGETLRACMEGILDIHKHVEGSRFGVTNRNLQPIEDNPLRLGFNYPDTMKTLFDTQKSIVHLSAPAAVEESLRNIKNHNEAMQYATSEALVQIVKAFSPDVLLKRFNNYKRNNETTDVSEDAWAWNMYRSYFSELTSSRQHGFEKLFWEIFEQSYDKKIREMQLER